MMSEKLEIIQDKIKERFSLFVNNNDAGHISYQFENNKITIIHTQVDKEYGGRGYAKLLVENVIDYARGNKFKIIPICPYAKKILSDNEKYQDVL